MKYMAHILAVSILCVCYGDVYGIDEKRSVFDVTTAMFFGGIACVCCAVFYIFHLREIIGQLDNALKKKTRDHDQYVQENIKIIDDKEEIINKKLQDYLNLSQQCLQLRLELGQASDCFEKMLQKSIDRKNQLAEMQYQYRQKEDELKQLRLKMSNAEVFFNKLFQEKIDMLNKENQRLYKENNDLKRELNLELSEYKSYSSSSSSGHD